MLLQLALAQHRLTLDFSRDFNILGGIVFINVTCFWFNLQLQQVFVRIIGVLSP